MKTYIAILEDEAERTSEMKKLLSADFSDYDAVFFDNTPEMLDWLKVNLDKTGLICLDHDLGPDRMIKGEMADPGTGRDIANYLETQEPTCPVIIHTTNSFGRDAMRFALQDAKWDTTVILPSAEISWIKNAWFSAVKKAIQTTDLSNDFELFEKKTGQHLPESVNRMYNHFGNGGFGSGSDVMGLVSGHTNGLGDTVLVLYNFFLQDDPDDPNWIWPKELIPICDLGCAMYICLDTSKKEVPVLKFDPNGKGPGSTKEDWAIAFTQLYPSLEEWINSWGNDK